MRGTTIGKGRKRIYLNIVFLNTKKTKDNELKNRNKKVKQ